MTQRTHSHTRSGLPIADELIEPLADEAEASYDADQIIARRNQRSRSRTSVAPVA